MALEDLAFFRTLFGAVVLYPSDAVSTQKLVEEAAARDGLVYIRTTRMATPLLYEAAAAFPIGGSKTLRRSRDDVATVIAAGITVHEALEAYATLMEAGIAIRVIDLYSVKPVDATTLKQAAAETDHLITVEDHAAQGGLADAVREALTLEGVRLHALAVRRKPKSGKPRELIDFEEIGHDAIVAKVRELVGG